ncbi:MAG: DUF1415 family protein [Polyangiaceae bacterium]
MDPWAREAVRVYRRYQLEIVEACGLCPWAERARLDGRVRERVILGEPKSEALARIAELAEDEEVEIGLLLFPKLTIDRAGFDRFIAKLQDADRERHELGQIPFMFAAFHPDAAADLSHPERLIPFLRRTPDPTIQLVRASVVDRMRSRVPQGTQFFDPSLLDAAPIDTGPQLREKIAQTNMATVKRMGVDELRAKLDDILRDRNDTYRALAS